MNNGNNNDQLDVEGLRNLIDSLYMSKNVVIDNSMPPKTKDEYDRLRGIVRSLYTTDGYANLVDILKSYPDKSYLPNTIGQYLFACIDIEPEKVGCLPICAKAILPDNRQYKPCSWPVYKINSAGALDLLESNGTNGNSDVAVVISATGTLPPAVVPALRDNGVKTVHLYREYPNRFVGTIDLTNNNPIPPGADLGKKAKDAGKGLKKAGGKSSWWTIAAMILGGIVLLTAIWYIFGGKNKNGDSTAPAPAETVRSPTYNMGRQYPIRNGGNFFC